jgi:hypothetical protein
MRLMALMSTMTLLGMMVFAQEIKMYSFLERLRLSSAVVEGVVERIEGETVRVEVQRVLKGSVQGPSIRVTWYQDLILGEPPLSYRPQDGVLLFLGRQQDGIYETVGRSQGTLGLPRPTDVYGTLIQQLLAFDAATTPSERTEIVADLLTSPESLSKETALEIIYLESNKVGLIGERLVFLVVPLTRDLDARIVHSAILVLGRIGRPFQRSLTSSDLSRGLSPKRPRWFSDR